MTDIEQRFKNAQLAKAEAAIAAELKAQEASFDRYVLGELRQVRRRLKLMMIEVDTIGSAMKRGWIDADTALTWLSEATRDLIHPPAPAAIQESDDVTEQICK